MLINEKPKRKRKRMPLSSFEKVFDIFLKKLDLFADGPLPDRKPRQTLKDLIETTRGALPGLYQDIYVEPLLRNFEYLQQRSKGTLETLAGAVYDHGALESVSDPLKRFAAFI
jgi:hypothetical protein